MQNIDGLITLIREGREEDALAMLEMDPELARAHSDLEGQLHGASPLHWAGHRNALRPNGEGRPLGNADCLQRHLRGNWYGIKACDDW